MKNYILNIKMEITPAMGRKDIIRCKSHLYKFSNSGILQVFSTKNLVLSGISQMQIWYFGTLWTWQPWSICLASFNFFCFLIFKLILYLCAYCLSYNC